MMADGGFIVVWGSMEAGTNTGIYAQRFSKDGTKINQEFLVPSLFVDCDYSFCRMQKIAGFHADFGAYPYLRIIFEPINWFTIQ